LSNWAHEQSVAAGMYETGNIARLYARSPMPSSALLERRLVFFPFVIGSAMCNGGPETEHSQSAGLSAGKDEPPQAEAHATWPTVRQKSQARGVTEGRAKWNLA
jgi:hypothetical protein